MCCAINKHIYRERKRGPYASKTKFIYEHMWPVCVPYMLTYGADMANMYSQLYLLQSRKKIPSKSTLALLQPYVSSLWRDVQLILCSETMDFPGSGSPNGQLALHRP